MVLVYCWVPRNPGSGGVRGTNVLGGILFAPAVACLLLVTTESAGWGWSSPLTLGFLAAGLVLLVAWIASELRARAPLINVRLLARREVMLVNLGGAVLGLSAFQFIQLWSILLQQPPATGVGLGLSATLAGWIMLPMTLMALVGGPAAGWLIHRFGGRLTIMGGALTLTLTWALATLFNDSVPWILAIMVVMGLGQAIYYSGIIILLTQAVPMARTSEATGMMVVIRLTTLGIGAQLVATLLDSSTVTLPTGPGSFPDAGAYLLAMSYITAGCVVMLAIAALLPGKKTLSGDGPAA
jgi:MFS family permease